MKTVVVTGSTRGIGLGLAKEFLKAGCKVVISGRKSADVKRVVEELSAISGSANVAGGACDVSDPEQVQALWDLASSFGGSVDIWVNNAGLGQSTQPAWEVTAETTRTIIRTNIEGTINGCTTAMRGMLQQGFGAIYNMEGLGSDGRKVSGLSNYGTSKAAVRYYSQALIEETKGKPVVVGTLQPGMVLTDMLSQEHVNPEEWKQLKTLYNFLADTVPHVTRWLTARVLANQKHGVHFNYMNTGRIMQHAFDAVFRGRDVVKEAKENNQYLILQAPH
jgi:NAD(P)-dependent dehydrogenase (short-subunit alcohol dehydrogenase family)